ncbi:MAG: 1-(5-phosphoribosyl)-5-[(5-phosphoribosylamino) methylideneamino]imidazole-4-carboxamide isomerase [Wenzhouxiangellaceae bacterium]
MKIYPAIDLIDGRCVRLYQGRYDRQTDYDANPADIAGAYAAAGAELLHVVDLSSARDGGNGQLSAIRDLCAALPIPVQAGGGVRGEDDLSARFEAGCQRVVVGSLAVTQTARFGDWLHRYGAERLVAALDVRGDQNGQYWPAIKGWELQAETDLYDLLDELCDYGLRHLLCTDIARDGVLGGPNQRLYSELCRRYPQLHIQASGGVGELSDLPPLRSTGVAAVIIGKALLDGRFSLVDARQAVEPALCR